MITEVSKKIDKIFIKCIQMHDLSQSFFPEKGDVTRNGVVDVSDYNSILSYVEGSNESFTRGQIKSMDVNSSNSVNFTDCQYLQNELGL